MIDGSNPSRVSGLLVAALLLLSTVGAVTTTAVSPTTTQIDGDNPLTRPAAISEYRDSGHVSRNLSEIDAELSVAKNADDAGVSVAPASDAQNHYIVLQYREDIPRTIRVYIPDDYFSPITDLNVNPTRGPAENVTYQPVKNRQYTAVTLTVTESGTVVLPVSTLSTTVYGGLADARKRVGDAFNISVPGVPGVSGPEHPWQRVDEKQLASESVVEVSAPPDKAVVQYRVVRNGQPSWIPAPDSEDRDAPVYVLTKDGVDDRVWVVSTTSDPPAVRYKKSGSPTSSLGGAIDDILAVPNRLLNDIKSLF